MALDCKNCDAERWLIAGALLLQHHLSAGDLKLEGIMQNNDSSCSSTIQTGAYVLLKK